MRQITSEGVPSVTNSRVFFNASDTSSLGMFRKNDVYCVDCSKDDVDRNEETVVFSDVRLNMIEVS